MNIALIGATGFVGSAALQELLERGHRVTALARTPAKLPPRNSLAAVAADVRDAGQVADAVRNADAVLSAFNPGWDNPQLFEQFLQGSRAIIAGVKAARVPRLVVVGGAGSLYVAPGVQLVDTPQFGQVVPANVVPGARAARDLLTELRGEAELDWVFVSPPAMLAAGERTGRYQLGGEELPITAHGPAGISVADLAVALVDELETPRHHRQRFTAWTP